MSITLIALTSLAAVPQGPPPEIRHTLMPVPASLAWHDGRLRLEAGFQLRGAAASQDGRLRRALARTTDRLARATGLTPGSGGAGAAFLDVRVQGPGEAVQSPAENESYRLEITAAGATLDAPTTVGALRGFETLLQLVAADSAGWYLPAVRIEDAPRFPWRGLLIDVGRHFEPAPVIKRQLDAMAVVKLNVLHWHLSEDQGFRIESLKYPLLHQRGSDGLYYTRDEIQDVVGYARDRGIRVVPEFDVPGHSTAWFVGYPQYASGPGPFAIERRFGVFPPTFDPTREATYQFLDGFLAEAVTLFPDRYWHIGGDEVEGSQWKNNSRIKAFMREHKLADNEALQAYFNRRLSTLLEKHRRRMVGWDEILHPDLPATTVIQSWRGQRSLVDGARRGFNGILSAPYYLDHMQTAETHYLADPLPEGHGLSPQEAQRVLGGEACMWHEHVTPASIDSRIWPRMGAIAERFWSPREVRDVPDMYRRLAVLRVRLEALGLGSESHTGAMARQLAGEQEPGPLISLLELTEPVSFGERSRLQRPTQLTPLSFAVDAARPDPPAHWNLRALAAMASSARPGSAAARRELGSRFREWTALFPAVDAMARVRPLVREVLPAARALARAAAIGSEALQRLEMGPLPADWARTSDSTLATLATPQGLLRVSVIPGVRRLLKESGPP